MAKWLEEVRRLKAQREQKGLAAPISAGRTGQEEAENPPAPIPPDRVLTVTAPSRRGGGPSPTRPGGVTLALSLQSDGTCYCCKGSRWWLSRYGVLVCATCHPPPVPELVARYVDAEEAARFARG